MSDTALPPATVTLTLDNANCDGRIIQQGFGIDWPARDEHHGPERRAVAPTWQYDAECEYIPALDLVAPAGVCTPMGMYIGAGSGSWVPLQGLWQNSPSAGYLQRAWLHYYDGRPNRQAAGEYGQIESVRHYAPNLGVWIWRMAGAAEETDPPLVLIRFRGDLESPEYALLLPGSAAQQAAVDSRTAAWTCPMLLGRERNAGWTIIDEFRSQGTRSATAGGRPQLEYVSIEHLDDAAIIHLNDQQWVYSGPWVARSGRKVDFQMQEGPLRFEVCGHPAMFCVGEMHYPQSVLCNPVEPVHVPDGWETAPKYRTLAATIPGTTAVVVSQDGLLKYGWSRPVVEFQTTNECYRAGLRCVQEYRVATLGDAISNPQTTDDNPWLGILDARWTLNDRWRGATLNATLEAEGADLVLDVVKSNAKVSAAVSLNPGSGDGPVTMFTGYVLPQEHQREAEIPGHVTAELQAADWLEARGPGHYMIDRCSYERWPIKDVFEYELQRAGVAAANISVDPAITSSNYMLPASREHGRRLYQYRPDQLVVSALEEMVRAVDCEWGVDELGVCFLRPRLVRPAGYFDYELTDDDVDPEYLLPTFRATGSIQDYINCLLVLAEVEGRLSAQMLLDSTSWSDPDAPQFIGEDRWHVEILRDPSNLQEVARTLWHQRHRLSRTVYWDMINRPEWRPDDYIQVNVAGCEVEPGTIVKIARQTGSVDREGQFRQGFEAVLAEEVTSGSGS